MPKYEIEIKGVIECDNTIGKVNTAAISAMHDMNKRLLASGKTNVIVEKKADSNKTWVAWYRNLHDYYIGYIDEDVAEYMLVDEVFPTFQDAKKHLIDKAKKELDLARKMYTELRLIKKKDYVE